MDERLGVVEERVSYQNVYARRVDKEKTDNQSKRLRPGKKERQETKQRTNEVDKEFNRSKEKEEGRKEFDDKNSTKRQQVKLKPAELPENFEQYQMDENGSYDENLNYGEEELHNEDIDASEYEEPTALVVTEETDRSVLN